MKRATYEGPGQHRNDRDGFPRAATPGSGHGVTPVDLSDDRGSRSGESGLTPQLPASSSIGTYAVVLVLALLVPLLAYAGYVTHRLNAAERLRLEEQTTEAPKDAVAMLDRYVAGRIATLQVLATSLALDTADFERFEQQAREFTEISGSHVVLRDLTGQQRVNTRLPKGAPTQPTYLDTDRAVVEARAPLVSDLLRGPNTGSPMVLIRVPVVRGGEVKYLLSMALNSSRLAEILRFNALPAPYRMSLTDRSGSIITRSIEPERYIGKALPGFDAIKGDHGTWEGKNLEGLLVFGAYRRSELTGFIVTVGLDRDVLEAPLRQSYWMLAGLALVLSALGLFVVVPIVRRLAAAQIALARRAVALRQGDVVAPLNSGVREFDTVAGIMAEASDQLRAQSIALAAANRELEQRVAARTAELAQTSGMLRTTLDNMDQGLIVIDAQGKLPVISRKAITLLGLPSDVAERGLTLWDVRAMQDAMGEFDGVDEGTRTILALDPMTDRPAVYERTRPNGVVLEIRTVALEGGGAVRTFTDVTQRRRKEDAIRESERRYRTLADSLPQKVWIARPDGIATYYNRQMIEYHGPIGMQLADRIASNHPDEAAAMTAARQKAYAEGSTFEIEGRLRRFDGAWRWHRIVMIPIHSEDGEVVEWLGTSLDIDDLYTAKQKLAETGELLKLAQDAAGGGIWEWDAATGIARHSCESARMFGLACEPGATIDVEAEAWRALCHPEDVLQVWVTMEEALKRGGSYGSEFRVKAETAPDGWRWVLGCGRVVVGPKGEPTGLVGLNFDITERKSAELRIAHMARHDSLTDLPNRVLFREMAQRKLAHVRRHGGTLALLCLDLDRFKAVNDTLGHQAGDELLRKVADRMRATLREEDTLARLGGDEFAVLLGGSGLPQEVSRAAERLVEAVGTPFEVLGQSVSIGLSVGMAIAPEDGQIFETLHQRADAALYDAKAAGRSTFRFWGERQAVYRVAG